MILSCVEMHITKRYNSNIAQHKNDVWDLVLYYPEKVLCVFSLLNKVLVIGISAKFMDHQKDTTLIILMTRNMQDLLQYLLKN